MKLERLHLQDFRLHGSTELELEGLTIVAGANASGKSSIRQAIEVCLTGRCEATDRAGRGLANLIRLGSERAVVTLTIRGLGEVVRTITPSGSRLQVADWRGGQRVQQELLCRAIGADVDLISAVCRMADFPSLPVREQWDLMVSVLHPITRAQLLGYLGQVAPDDGPALAEILGDIPESIDLPWVEEAYERVYQERRETKRRLDEVTRELASPGLPDVPQVGPDQAKEIRERLVDLEGEVAELNQMLGEMRARREAFRRRESALARLQELEASLPDEVPDVESLARREEELRREVADRKAALDDLAARIRDMDADIAAIRKTTQCPVSQAIACPLGRDDRRKIVASLQAERKKLVAQHAKLQQEHAKAATRLDELAAELERARQVQQLVEEREHLREELEGLPSGEFGEEDEQDILRELEDLNREICEGRENLARLELAMAHKETVAQKRALAEELQERVKLLEILAEAFGPGGNGIRAIMLEAGVEAIESRVNDNLEILTGGHYRLRLQNLPEPSIWVDGPGGHLQLIHLSTSERMRVGCAFAEALAHLSGLGLLIIDDAEILDEANRAHMSRWLIARREDYDTVILLSTGPRERLHPQPGIRCYYLDGGRAQEVT